MKRDLLIKIEKGQDKIEKGQDKIEKGQHKQIECSRGRRNRETKIKMSRLSLFCSTYRGDGTHRLRYSETCEK